MKYTSTRDESTLYSFEEALTSGYAPDGGLFVPERLPVLQDPSSTLKEWSKLSYSELATQVLRRFISESEISTSDLENLLGQAFADFPTDIPVVPVKRIGPIFVAELFHGPTFCFKDLGMRAVVNMLNHFAAKKSQKITLVVSTTGDTGK